MHRGRPLVLVVADDSDIRCNCVSWLSDAGFRCIVTDNAPTALWYVRRLEPAVTVVEIGDRGERLRLATCLASDPRSTPLVLTSPSGSRPRLPVYPDCHVVDPRSREELLDAINAARAVHSSLTAARVAGVNAGARCS